MRDWNGEKTVPVKDTGTFATMVVEENQAIGEAFLGVVKGLPAPLAQTSLDGRGRAAIAANGLFLKGSRWRMGGLRGRRLRGLLVFRRHKLLPGGIGIGTLRMGMMVAVAAFVETGFGCRCSLTFAEKRAGCIDGELLEVGGSTDMHRVLLPLARRVNFFAVGHLHTSPSMGARGPL